MDYFKTYDSGHLYGIGRIIAVVTVHKEGETFTIETFAFSLHDDSLFKGTVARYDFDASEMIDKGEIELQARNIIDQVIFEKFEENKDTSILQNPNITEIKESILIYMKSRNYHIEEFKDMCEKTHCESFRQYLDAILSIPKITVTEYSL